jgi:hypothetical protein
LLDGGADGLGRDRDEKIICGDVELISISARLKSDIISKTPRVFEYDLIIGHLHAGWGSRGDDVVEELPIAVAGGITEEEADVEARLDEVMMRLIGDDLYDCCGECEKMGERRAKGDGRRVKEGNEAPILASRVLLTRRILMCASIRSKHTDGSSCGCIQRPVFTRQRSQARGPLETSTFLSTKHSSSISTCSPFLQAHMLS